MLLSQGGIQTSKAVGFRRNFYVLIPSSQGGNQTTDREDHGSLSGVLIPSSQGGIQTSKAVGFRRNFYVLIPSSQGSIQTQWVVDETTPFVGLNPVQSGRYSNGGFMATVTPTGKVLIPSSQGGIQTSYSFQW